jgi:hypothetical protein
MKHLTKQQIQSLPKNVNLYCIGKVDGKIIFTENKDLLITKRTGKFAKTHGEFAMLSILNKECLSDVNFITDFSDHSLQSDGRLIEDSGYTVYELTLYSSREEKLKRILAE